MKDARLFTLPCRLGDSKPFDTLADLGSCLNLILLYLFKKLKIGLLEETEHIFGLADGTKSYPVGIVRNVEVHIGKLKLLEDFYVIDMEKDTTCPLLVGRGFLATANAVIDCKKAKIAVKEGITKSIFGFKEIDLEDDSIDCLNKAMDFLTTVASLRYKSNATSSRGNNASGQDFWKCFVPQQELSADETLWYHMLNPYTKSSDALPIKIEAPKELPKVSLVNESLKKLKLHLANFDKVVKIWTTPNAQTEVKWGFEHTKAVFNNEIIPFLKFLKDIFNVFDRDLLNEIMEVQTAFDQIDVDVQQSLVDKQCLENAKKDLLLENDQLLKQNESCDKCVNLKAELLKSQNTFNDLLKRHSQLEKHCISIECSIQLNQEIIQKRESCDIQNALEIPELFAFNDLKAQLQNKDSTICMLKDIIKSMREKSKDKNVNYDYGEIVTKNVELENCVAKLILENERLCNEINHVKLVFREQFDSIKKTRVRSTVQSDSLIDKVNLKSAKNEDLKAQIQDKVESSTTSYRNTHVLSLTGLKCSTSNCGSMPSGNKKNDRISQTPSRNIKNKVEAQPRNHYYKKGHGDWSKKAMEIGFARSLLS
uniref:Reverse transcriptase domain-containing protein n=1 Tax=Tanacetum cinerariifolium TaxID=118510 RepID=A0A6L2JKA8_TANCI|nr:hypothetical protein [Tanacetum cinerariifolium]